MLLSFYKKMYEKVATLHHIYKVNAVAGTDNYETLNKWSHISFLVCKFGALLILCSFMFFIPYTLVYNAYTGYQEPIMPVYLFGVDETTFVGYATLCFYHFMILSLASAGTICADLLLVMLVVHMFPMTEIVGHMFGQINVQLRVRRQEHNVHFDRYFRNILLAHKEVCG